VIDTSRNGLGPAPDGDWCNPPGRALGLRPGSATGVSRQDANVWVKRPGESDGPCHGGPPAGAWWADYALGLARRAAYYRGAIARSQSRAERCRACAARASAARRWLGASAALHGSRRGCGSGERRRPGDEAGVLMAPTVRAGGRAQVTIA
jgi:hypothetical protein